MDTIFTKLKSRFVQADILWQFIIVNVSVFIALRLVTVVLTLCGADGANVAAYLQMPSSPTLLLHRPWTLLTYMFLHLDFLHILFNMLWLYWFGKIFLMFFTGRQFGGLYVSGGIAGAVLFLLACNVFPFFRNAPGPMFLMGASASVMAIVFAVSFYQKNYEIYLLLIGRVKLIYLAWFTLLIDLLSLASDNAGGHVAHVGGALFGIWFAVQLQKGRDVTGLVNRGIDRLVNLRKRQRPHMKVVYGRRPESDMEYNARKREEADALDAILDKLKRSGYDSLSADEKKILFDASRK